jgi:heat shock protein HslJ
MVLTRVEAFRMRQKLGWTVLGLVGPALVVAGCGAGSSGSVSTGADPRPSIEGKWYPVEIAGYTVDPLQAQTYPKAYLEFEGGKWHGSDGCNGAQGSYELSGDGVFGAKETGATTLIGCANVPNSKVLDEATRAEVDGGTLVFSASAEIARYSRTPNPPSPMPKEPGATDPSRADSGPTIPAATSSAEASVLKKADPSVPPPP